MEFHDILHGHIQFKDKNILGLLTELLDSPEVNRLRNMRQMNFDVPLIQELGRSRRLPHSIGVVYIALKLAHKSALPPHDLKILICAAILHDAAIPPYGHLIESEFKRISSDFNHEKRLDSVLNGTVSLRNRYEEAVPTRQFQVTSILEKYNIPIDSVIEIVRPTINKRSPISADIDIDNIDNVHRMAAMLGWSDAKENLSNLLENTSIKGLKGLFFSKKAVPYLEKWLEYRQRIYTLIIAHPQCIPYNALQTDLARLAVKHSIIEPDDWIITEPVFEERLRVHPKTKKLALQLISGCEYTLVDYCWFKNFKSSKKISNAEIAEIFSCKLELPEDHTLFIWNEKGLISREVDVPGIDWDGCKIGSTSTSCMVALIKKTPGKSKRLKRESLEWRMETRSIFSEIFNTKQFEVDYPENYTGNFLSKNNELQFDYF